MRITIFLFIFQMASSANAGFFSKTKVAADGEGNCLPEVINENARLFGEIEALDKIAGRSETQAKSPVAESQKLGLAGFKELSAKVKVTRAGVKKFADTYGDASCKAMVKKKNTMFVVKERAASLDKLAVGYEKMAEDYLKPPAKK